MIKDFTHDLLDPELSGVLVEPIQILFSFPHITLQRVVDLLDDHLVPTSQYIPKVP
jgi:hypothetical protein